MSHMKQKIDVLFKNKDFLCICTQKISYHPKIAKFLANINTAAKLLAHPQLNRKLKACFFSSKLD